MTIIIKNIFSNKSSIALLCKASSAICSFIFVLVVARLLSTEDAGVFLYTYSLMMILVQLARAGTEHSLVKSLSGKVTKKAVDLIIIKTGLYVGLIAAVLVSILIILAVSGLAQIYTEEDNLQTLYYFSSIVFLFALSQVLGSYFQARYEVYSQYWAMNVGIVMLASILVIVLLALDAQISSLMLSQLFFAVNGIILIWCLALYLKSSAGLPKLQKSEPDIFPDFVTLIKFTLPFSVLAFITILVQWGGQLLASLWLDSVELGVLSICVRLAVLVNFVFVAFNALISPKISQLYQDGAEDEIYKSTILHTAISSASAVVMTVTFIVVGEQLLGLFGSDYIVGYDSLLILSVSWLIRVFIGPVDIILLMTDQVKSCRRNLYVSASVSIVSACVFIPWLGTVGAVLSMALSGVLLSVLNCFVVIRLYGIRYIGLKELTDQVVILKKKIKYISKNSISNFRKSD